jgi:hypothetical protein
MQQLDEATLAIMLQALVAGQSCPYRTLQSIHDMSMFLSCDSTLLLLLLLLLLQPRSLRAPAKSIA